MRSRTAYHGSLLSGIGKFKPTSHFGSRIQAFCAIVAHAALDKECGVPTIYDCNLVCKESEIFHIKDWGSPKPQAVLYWYCSEIGRMENFREEYYRKAMNDGLDPYSIQWIEWLILEANLSGHKLLSYENKVEGEGLSYCVIDESIVRIVKSEEVSFSQLKRDLESAGRQSFGFDDREWSEIQKHLAETAGALRNCGERSQLNY